MCGGHFIVKCVGASGFSGLSSSASLSRVVRG
jgi:hypothetical protein